MTSARWAGCLQALACFVAACGAWASLPACAAVWVVEAQAPAAHDRNAGHAGAPLKTLGEAMRRLKPGDEVVVGEGVYRELVVVPRLPPGGDVVTVIRAREAGRAVISGSDPVEGWRPGGAGRFSVDWRGRAEPSQVYVGGRPLRQIAGTVFGGYPERPGHELADTHRSEGGIWQGRVPGDLRSLQPGDFFYEGATQTLHVRLAEGQTPGSTPATAVEVSTRPYVFLAEAAHRLRVEGLRFEHANTSSLARQGAVKVFGNHNVLQGLHIRRMDAVGLQLFGTGSQLLDSVIEDSGQMGLNARGRQLTIARNSILNNNLRGFNKWWEAGGIKIIGDDGLHDSVFRDNVVAFNRGDGIWIDWENTGIRISGNTAAFNTGFGIHYEASSTGWIDGNASYGNGQRGIYVFESSDTRVEGNLVVANGLEGIVVADGERSAQRPQMKPRNNRVTGNVVGWNKDIELMLALPEMNNHSEGNVFLAERAPALVQGWSGLTNRPARGLASWRQRSGFDLQSRELLAPPPAALLAALREQRLLRPQALRELLQTALPTLSMPAPPAPPALPR